MTAEKERIILFPSHLYFSVSAKLIQFGNIKGSLKTHQVPTVAAVSQPNAEMMSDQVFYFNYPRFAVKKRKVVAVC